MSTIYPNLGLIGNFACNEDAVSSINSNIEKLDDLVLQGIDGIVTTLPASPTEGDAVILDGTNQVNVYSNGAWHAYSPKPGWMFVDTTDCSLLIFDGTDWKKLPLPQDYVNFITNAGNIGGGVGTFAQITSGVAEFKSLVAGANITITDLGTEILIQASGLNSASNLGAGQAVFAQVNGLGELEFKTLVEGTGITMTSDANEITINSTSSSTKVIENVTNPGAGAFTYTMSSTSLTDLFILNTSPDDPIDFVLSDPTLTVVGKTVTLKNFGGSLNGGVAISAAGSNLVEQNNTTVGATASFGNTSIAPSESLTYTNDGTRWHLISRVKY